MPSTVIHSFDYNAVTGVLTIRFVTGTEYVYFDVPQQVYIDFKKFREKGIFYNKEIKGKYRFERVN